MQAAKIHNTQTNSKAEQTQATRQTDGHGESPKQRHKIIQSET